MTFIFFIYPLGALPLILWGIYERKKTAYVLFSLFWGMIGMLYAPNGDLFRYFSDYYLYSNQSFNDFQISLILQAKVDFGLSYLQWCFAKLGIGNDIIVFIFVSLGTLMIMNILYETTQNVSKRNSFLLFFIVFLNISFLDLYFRYNFATIIFTFGCYNLLYKNSKFGWIYVIISLMFHAAMLIFATILFLTFIFKIRMGKNVFLILTICTFLFSFDFLTSKLLTLAVPPQIQSKIIAYSEGYWAKEWLNDRSFASIVSAYFNIFWRIICYYIIYKCYRKDLLHSLIGIIQLLLILAAPFATIVHRFNCTLTFICLILILPAIKGPSVLSSHVRNTIINLFLIIGIGTTLCGITLKRFIIPISEEQMILYSPSFVILSHRYTEKWIEMHAELGD